MAEPAGPAAKAPAPCSICGKPRSAAYRPFCSARCADVDLNRWLTGVYSIPVVEEEDAGDEPAPGFRDGDNSNR
jgi:uncharacterized protein